MQTAVYLFFFVILVLSNVGWCSVSLSDPDKICGSHTVPGKTVKLNCDVNNTGAYYHVLRWRTPVIVQTNSDTLLVAESSTSSHSITYSGNISDSTLTVTIMTDNGDVVNYTARIDHDHLNISSDATFNGNSTNITMIVRVKSENTNSTNHSVTLNTYNPKFSYQQRLDENIMSKVTVESRSYNEDLALTKDTLYASNSIFSATATFNGNLANSTLTFEATESLDDKVVTCEDNLGNSKDCTLQIYTTPNAPSKLVNTSVTFQSVSLSWIAPSDTGGRAIMNYIITVTPLGDPWNITTTDNTTSYTVTGLMFGQRYSFTVRANYSTGPGDISNIVTVTLPGEVPRPVSIDICMDYLVNGTTKLNISWNPCPPIFNINTTPPVENYTLLISHHGDPINLLTCSHSQLVIENTYTVSVTANNIVGSSQMTFGSFNARWLTNVTPKNDNIANYKVEYTTAICVVPVNLTVQLTYNNDTKNIPVTLTKRYVANTRDSFILSSLQPSATIYYTLQVIDTNSNTIGSTSTGSFMITPSPSSSPTPSSSVMPTTTTTTTTPIDFPVVVIIGIAVGAPILLIVLIVVIIIICCVIRPNCKGNQKMTSIKLNEILMDLPMSDMTIYQ